MNGRVSYSVKRKIKEFVQQKQVEQNPSSSWKGTCSDHANRNIEDCCKRVERRNKCLP